MIPCATLKQNKGVNFKPSKYQNQYETPDRPLNYRFHSGGNTDT
jgi:hypothetical protein